MSEKWAYLAEFTADDIEVIDEPLQAAKELLTENAALRRLIKDEFDFGEGEIRHYLKHALLKEPE